MRFEELHLLKYGNFEGCDLTFPKQPEQLPLIPHDCLRHPDAGKTVLYQQLQNMACIADPDFMS